MPANTFFAGELKELRLLKAVGSYHGVRIFT